MRFEPFQRRLNAVVRATTLQHQLLFSDPNAMAHIRECAGSTHDSVIAVVDENFVLLRHVDHYHEHWRAILQHMAWQADLSFTLIVKPVLFTQVLHRIVGDGGRNVVDPQSRSLALQLLHLEQNKLAYLEWLLRDQYWQLSNQWRAALRIGKKESIGAFMAARRAVFYEQILSVPDLHDDFWVFRRVVRDVVAAHDKCDG